MRLYVGHPLPGGFFGGIGVGGRHHHSRTFYARSVAQPTVDVVEHGHSSAWAQVFALTLAVGILMTFWPLFLAMVIGYAALVIHARNRAMSEAAVAEEPKQMGVCWIKGCRRRGEWRITLSKPDGASAGGSICGPHLRALEGHLPVKQRHTD